MIFQKAHSPVVVDQDSLIDLKSSVPEMVLKATREAVYSGMGETRSIFKNQGLDFQEIRPYQPGDDIRQIDWRNTAKYGKPFTKLYMEEKERPVYLLCDMRSSMKFASRGDFKSVVAARAMMFLATLSERKKDKIHTIIMMSELIKTMRLDAVDGGVLSLIPDLIAASVPTILPPNQTSIGQAFHEMDRILKKGSFIFICSDFHDLDEEAIAQLSRMSDRKTVVLIHIYDPLEAKLPRGILTMTDGSKTLSVNTRDSIVEKSFENSFKQRVQKIRDAAQKYGWGYLPLKTNEDYLMKLAEYNQN